MVEQYRSRPRQGRSGESIDAVLDAAELVFRRHGVADATTVMIAQQAGVSVGRLYYWFADKTAIADALSRRHQDRLVSFLTDQLVDLEGVSTPTLVRRIVAAFAQFVRANPGSLALLHHDSTPAPDAAVANKPSMRSLMVDLVAGMVAARVDGATVGEQRLVAAMLVETVVGVLELAVLADAPRAAELEAELAYLIAAYLYARYPSNDDRAWTDQRHPIRPARHPIGPPGRVDPIEPTLPE